MKLNENQIKKIQEIYIKYCKMALNIENIEDWAVKKTVTKSVINETTTAQANVNEAIANTDVNEGDKIWLYITEHPEHPGNVSKKKYKLIENYNNDEHQWHYVSRVYKTTEILKNLIDIKKFPKYHNKTNRPKLEELMNETRTNKVC